MLVQGFEGGLVAAEGLLAHGRGEALDYLLGERTGVHARRACMAAASALCEARRPVISVNGNGAALCAAELVLLARQIGAALEVNLFYDNKKRREAIAGHLRRCGASDVLGINQNSMRELKGTDSARRMVDENGMWTADVVMVSLEDGDRTAALRRAGKRVIAIDLNPLSRTAQTADISIIDNITRACRVLADECKSFVAASKQQKEDATAALLNFNNKENMGHSIRQIKDNLEMLQGTSDNQDDFAPVSSAMQTKAGK